MGGKLKARVKQRNARKSRQKLFWAWNKPAVVSQQKKTKRKKRSNLKKLLEDHTEMKSNMDSSNRWMSQFSETTINALSS